MHATKQHHSNCDLTAFVNTEKDCKKGMHAVSSCCQGGTPPPPASLQSAGAVLFISWADLNGFVAVAASNSRGTDARRWQLLNKPIQLPVHRCDLHAFNPITLPPLIFSWTV